MYVDVDFRSLVYLMSSHLQHQSGISKMCKFQFQFAVYCVNSVCHSSQNVTADSHVNNDIDYIYNSTLCRCFICTVCAQHMLTDVFIADLNSVHIVAQPAHIVISYDIYSHTRLPQSGDADCGVLVYTEVTAVMYGLRMHSLTDSNPQTF